MEPESIRTSKAKLHIGKEVTVKGHVHALRKLGNLAFLLLRDSDGLLQVVVEESEQLAAIAELGLESAIAVAGKIQAQPKSASGAEMLLSNLTVLSQSTGALPVEINKESKLESLSLSAMLDYRPLTLRAPSIRAIFKIETEIVRAFREFLTKEKFVEIHSPKIVATGTEGGAQLFTVDYFGNKAYLAQSPQFYKQMMVGVFERVFEVGPVYRAEEHETSRHLNEYISMDYEMGFIESEQDVINLEVKLLRHIFAHLQEYCVEELNLLQAQVPKIEHIPQVTLAEAFSVLTEKLGWKPQTSATPDLDPEGERLLCQYFLKTESCDLVFVTRYPKESRPFYAMPLNDLTRSFDLLFRGLEVTTGGQRIHSYEQLCQSIRSRGMEPEAFADYLQCFRYGMPPHGGLAIGLERLTKQLLNLSNVRLASLFPRDRVRVSP